MAKKPTTATVKLELNYDDGSKVIVESSELDASQIPDFGATEASPSHICIGQEDPFVDRYDATSRHMHDSLARFCLPVDTHFFLRLRMEPKDRTGPSFTLREIEPPDTRMGMVWTGWELKPCFWTEEEIQKKAADTLHTSVIYFFLDIP